MGGFQHSIAGGQGNLVAGSFQSPNFVSGKTGWQVTRDGNAEFNNGVFRGELDAATIVGGTITGTDITGSTITGTVFGGTRFLINEAGAFFYDGTPAAGNLIASIAASAGTDGFGNAYPRGFALWQADPVQGNVASYLTGDAHESAPARLFTHVLSGSGTSVLLAILQSALNTARQDSVLVGLESSSADGTTASATGFLNYAQPDGTGYVMAEWGAGGFAGFGTMTAAAPGASPSSPAVAETWHVPVLAAGWTQNASNPVRYRLLPDGNVQWSGIATHAGFTTTQTLITSLDAAYVPAHSQEVPVGLGTSGATGIAVASSGVVQCRVNVTGTTTTTCNPQGSYPLD